MIQTDTIQSCFSTGNNHGLDIPNSGGGLNGFLPAYIGDFTEKYLSGIKGEIVAYYRAKGKWKIAENIEKCFESYRSYRCNRTGERYAKRYRCGQQCCAFCVIWLMEEFFYDEEIAENGSTLPTKASVLEANMTNPVIWRIKFPERTMPADVAGIKSIQKDLVKMCTRLADSYGKTKAIARDVIRGIRVKTQENIISFELILLGQYEKGDRVFLQTFFLGQSGSEVMVQEETCNGVRDAIGRFSRLMAIRIDADTVESYILCHDALKGSRLLQGKGIFQSIAGGIPKKKSNRITECDICGNCSPIEGMDLLPVATTQTYPRLSPITGKMVRYLDPPDPA